MVIGRILAKINLFVIVILVGVVLIVPKHRQKPVLDEAVGNLTLVLVPVIPTTPG